MEEDFSAEVGSPSIRQPVSCAADEKIVNAPVFDECFRAMRERLQGVP